MALTRFVFVSGSYLRATLFVLLTVAISAISLSQERSSRVSGEFDASLDNVDSLIANELMVRFRGKELFEREWQPILPSAGAVEARRKRAEMIKDGVFAKMPFKQDLNESDGLGPLYNAKSCVACHIAGGASGVEHNVTLLTIDLANVVDVVRGQNAAKSLPKLGDEIHSVFPGLIDSRGRLLLTTLVHDHSTRDGYEAIRQGLGNFVPDGIDEAWFDPEKRQISAIAARPVVSGRHDSFDFYLSQRNSPPLFGMGLISRIDSKRLRMIAQSQPKRSGGVISGRQAGRFGWRGQVETLAAFVSGACAGEMGLNQSFTQQPSDPLDRTYTNLSVDVTRAEVERLQAHVASIPAPTETKGDYELSKRLMLGERLFNTVGCELCHVADIRPATGIFSDLLLHDMGPELQSPAPASLNGRGQILAPIFEQYRSFETSGGSYYESSLQLQGFPMPYSMARSETPTFPKSMVKDIARGLPVPFEETWEGLQREWRTPPLWGVADTGPYLHDGRAATLEEAIRWHGGEAESARNKYDKLAPAEKELVLAFLGSLRAPVLSVQ